MFVHLRLPDFEMKSWHLLIIFVTSKSDLSRVWSRTLLLILEIRSLSVRLADGLTIFRWLPRLIDNLAESQAESTSRWLDVIQYSAFITMFSTSRWLSGQAVYVYAWAVLKKRFPQYTPWRGPSAEATHLQPFTWRTGGHGLRPFHKFRGRRDLEKRFRNAKRYGSLCKSRALRRWKTLLRQRREARLHGATEHGCVAAAAESAVRCALLAERGLQNSPDLLPDLQVDSLELNVLISSSFPQSTYPLRKLNLD